MDVGTCWPRETAATLSSARPREALRRPRGEEGRGRMVAAARLQLVSFAVFRHFTIKTPTQIVVCVMASVGGLSVQADGDVLCDYWSS